MKIGVRKPSIKKSIKAKTTGKAKRKLKKAVNPMYGKKGMGLVKNPKKALYNKVYNKTTVGAKDLFTGGSNGGVTGGSNTDINIINGIMVFFIICIVVAIIGFIVDHIGIILILTAIGIAIGTIIDKVKKVKKK